MSDKAHLLLEIGTEELPPKTLNQLGEALFDEMSAGLVAAALEFNPTAAQWFVTPRRLAVSFPGLARQQADRSEQRLGPQVDAAFDAQGEPTKAALGFARSCGISVDNLQRVETDKGIRLAYTREIAGALTIELLPDIIANAASRLPVSRPMRWGAREESFVRPVHWIVALLDTLVISGQLLGCSFGRNSRGHRFHHPEEIVLDHADHYLESLERGKVIADPLRRREMIRAGVEQVARSGQGQAVISDPLLDEVANLTEWPVAVLGSFDEDFLSVPGEALISSMENHQKFFSVVDPDQRLMPLFVAVANLDSTHPDTVRQGFERVIRPRLADARFFWEKDLKTPLVDHQKALANVVYQKDVGSLWDKVERVSALARNMARQFSVDADMAARSAALSKCDLMTEMVGEFPELQGTMGRHYALAQGEPEVVARAIEEHYQPRFAGAELPASRLGQVLALADRVDTLCAIFSAGLRPTGNRDPFGLRRAGLGLIRILVENTIDLDLEQAVAEGLELVSRQVPAALEMKQEVLEFVMDRLRTYYLDQGLGADVFDAVWARRPTRPLDFHRRVIALTHFKTLEPAAALAAANKRIGNILKKSDITGAENVDPQDLVAPEEKHLHQNLAAAAAEVEPLLGAGDYSPALIRLSLLRPSVDAFFDEVMVMCEEADLRRNRLALLSQVKSTFDDVADISRLLI